MKKKRNFPLSSSQIRGGYAWECRAIAHRGIARDCCVFCSWHSPFCYIFHACKLLSSSFQNFTLFTRLTALGRLYYLKVPLEL